MRYFLFLFSLSLFAQESFPPLSLGGRYYVENVLLSVFGKNIENQRIINETVLSSAMIFGDPCVLYEQVFQKKAGQKTLLDARTDCQHNIHLTKIPLFGRPSTMRSGLLARACESLAQNPQNIDYAYKKIHQGLWRNPTPTQLQQAYQLFYPERILPPPFATSLMQMAAHQGPAERWRWVFLTLCLSEYWQIQ